MKTMLPSGRFWPDGRLLIVLVVAVLAPRFMAAEEAAASFHPLDFDAACKQAGTEGKVVFIDFYTTWCGPCKMLDQTTWKDPSVVALLAQRTVAIKLDAEKVVDLAKRYRIEAYPTLLVLKPDGTEIDRLVGYRPAATFVREFTGLLSGKTALIQAEEAAKTAVTEEEKVNARYQLGRMLAQNGKREEALKEFLWCYDDGMKHTPSYTGVRSYSLLTDIALLGRNYSPAQEALRTRRDEAWKVFEQNATDREEVGDFYSLNHALGDDELTWKTFEALPEGDSRKILMAYFVYDRLLAARRYSEAVQAQPFTEVLSQIMAQQAMLRQMQDRPELLPEIRKAIAGVITSRVEAFAGAGELAHARELMQKVLEIDNSAPTKELLRVHLERAGHPELLGG